MADSALFFAYNFLEFSRKRGYYMLITSEEAFHTITIELHLKESSFNCTILLKSCQRYFLLIV